MTACRCSLDQMGGHMRPFGQVLWVAMKKKNGRTGTACHAGDRHLSHVNALTLEALEHDPPWSACMALSLDNVILTTERYS
jgi:hypothetical protein